MVIVKGKYLAAIETYVSTLVLDQRLVAAWNPEFEALQESIVKLHGSFLSKHNAVHIVFEQCLEFGEDHPDRTGSLSDPDNADLRLSLVSRIKEYLETLPRRYTLRIGLPSFPHWGAAVYKISESIRIVLGEQQLTGKNALAQFFVEPAGITHIAPPYIEFSVKGYSDGTPDSPATSTSLSIAKQCAFILDSHGVCRPNYSQKKSTAILIDETAKITKQIVLPDAIARCFGELSIVEKNLYVDEKDGKMAPSSSGRSAATNEEKSGVFDWLLYFIRRYFEAQSHPDSESIAVAIEWYQDSHFADNQNFAYIAACIGLEALFGSEDHLENMSKRLADRYAFLLGKNRTERKKMIDDYTKILNLRGRLVHSKAARLGGDDLHMLYTVRKMLKDAIWHELYAMYQTKDDSEEPA